MTDKKPQEGTATGTTVSLTLSTDDLPGIWEVYSEWLFGEARTPPHDWVQTFRLHRACDRDLVVRWLASKGHDCHWAREIPEALAECCRRVGRGKGPLAGALSRWRRPMDTWLRRNAQGTVMACSYKSDFGWEFMGEEGAETGEEGKRLADEAARAAGWWLL